MPGRDLTVDGARLRAGGTGAGTSGRQARIGRPENAQNLRPRVLVLGARAVALARGERRERSHAGLSCSAAHLAALAERRQAGDLALALDAGRMVRRQVAD